MVTSMKASKRKGASANIYDNLARSSKKQKTESANLNDASSAKASKHKTDDESITTENLNSSHSKAVAKASIVVTDLDADKSNNSDEEELLQLIDEEGSSKSSKKKNRHMTVSSEEKSGVVYLSRIPHGFYENEMRAYFSQFGQISRLRLARNKLTGQSKHYAFIEFVSKDVAVIVAETMNNYLLYGHILKCKVLSEAECFDKMWVGANRRWKVRPVTKLRKIRHDRKKPLEAWQKIEGNEQKRRLKASDKWKELGIEYEFQAPIIVDSALEAINTS